MSHIFISYSREDIVFVRHLKQLLEAQDFPVWIDETRLEPGQRWWQRIENNINACAAFIVVMSPAAEESEWVERELLFAERVGKPIFPVLLGGDYWPRLAEIQFVDMTRGTDAALPLHLIHSLRALVPARVSAPMGSPTLMAMPTKPMPSFPPHRGDPAPTMVTRPFDPRLLGSEAATLIEPPNARSRPSPPRKPSLARKLSAPLLFVIAFSVGLLVAWVLWGHDPASRADDDELITAYQRTATVQAVAQAATQTAILAATQAQLQAYTSTPEPQRVPELALYYDDYALLVVNIAGTPLDISDIMFRQVAANGATREFKLNHFATQPGTLAPPSRVPPGGCYGVLSTEAVLQSPSRTLCTHFLGYFRTGVTRRYVWLPQDDSEAAFFSVLRDDGTVLAECLIADGSCLVDLLPSPT